MEKLNDSKLIFCNCAYLEHYNSDLDTEPPINGGKFVKYNDIVGERDNFKRAADGNCYGYVEIGYKDGVYPKICLENIDKEYKKYDDISDVTVIFCARSNEQKATVIVGWYKHATVYRHIQNDRYYFVASADDCYTVPAADRNFIIPRAKKNIVGFGQKNIWYARQPQALTLTEKVLYYINERS